MSLTSSVEVEEPNSKKVHSEILLWYQGEVY